MTFISNIPNTQKASVFSDIMFTYSMMWQMNLCIPYAKPNFNAKRADVLVGHDVKVRIDAYEE